MWQFWPQGLLGPNPETKEVGSPPREAQVQFPSWWAVLGSNQSCWLPSRYSCQSHTLRALALPGAVVYSITAGQDCWLIPSLEACMAPSGPKLVLRRPWGQIQLRSESCVKVHDVFLQQQGFTFLLGEATKGNSNSLQHFGSLQHPSQKFRTRLLKPGVGNIVTGTLLNQLNF